MIMLKKWTNILSYVIGIGVIVSILAMSVAISSKNKKIKTLKSDLKQKELVIDSLEKRCAKLGEMEAISVKTTFEVKNINTLGIQHTGNIQQLSESYASYTRSYLLDSIYKKK